MDFQVTLPSNASTSTFSSNKASSYKVQLAHEVVLSGSWEVALIDIQFPNTVCNVVRDTVIMAGVWNTTGNGRLTLDQYTHQEATKNSIDLKTMTYMGFKQNDSRFCYRKVSIPKGSYHSIGELCQYIKEKVIKAFPNQFRPILEISYDEHTRMIDYDIHSPLRNLQIALTDSYLFQLLGFTFTKYGEGGDFTRMSNTDSVETWIQSDRDNLQTSNLVSLQLPAAIYVYSNICEHQLVGDSLVPLLGVFPITDSKQRYWRFNPPFYIPLKQKSMNTIEIQLNDGEGNLVEFLDGAVIVRLHFRGQRYKSI